MDDITSKLIEKIESEVHDADCYMKMSMSIQKEDPVLSQVLYDISLQEMEHMHKLHDAAMKRIEERRKMK